MTGRKSRFPVALAFFAVLFSLSLHHVLADGEPKFSLGGAPGTATAIVTDEALNLTVETGPVTDYEQWKAFVLIVGGCSVNVNGSIADDGGPKHAKFKLKATGSTDRPITVDNFERIDAKPAGLLPFGKSDVFRNCTVSFGNKKDDGAYRVKVELNGDVPPGFKLASDALMDGGSGGSGGEGAADESTPGSNKTALIVGVVGGIVALILIAGGVGGFFAYRFYKKKALEKQTGKGQAKTAKRAGNKPPSSTVTDDAKSTEPASKSVDRKKTKDGNEKGAPEARKAMSKDGSAKKPGGGNAKTLTEGSEKKPEKVWWIS